MHIFFSVGEPSGDQHGAHLIHELRKRDPSIRCTGFGGPQMEAAGFESLFRLTDLAVMGIGAVLPLIPKFHEQYRRARTFFQTERPDVCLLIDFPGFNWWVASAAKEAGVEVVYYCPPQMWAWAGWRIRKMRRWVDRIISVLPFEAEWFAARNMPVEYVGHPFFDEVAEKVLKPETLDRLHKSSPRRVGLLPGSRTQEVRRNFPLMVDAARLVAQKHPDVRFPVACFRESHRQFCEQVLAQGNQDLPIDLCLGDTSEIIQSSDCLLMVSGSVSLEVLARQTPATVVYRASPMLFTFGHLFKTINFLSLPNLMVNRHIMPEFPIVRHSKKNVQGIADSLDRWLSDESARQATIAEMKELASTAASRGGIGRAADSLLRSRKLNIRAA